MLHLPQPLPTIEPDETTSEPGKICGKRHPSTIEPEPAQTNPETGKFLARKDFLVLFGTRRTVRSAAGEEMPKEPVPRLTMRPE